MNKWKELSVLWVKSINTLIEDSGYPWNKSEKDLFYKILDKLVRILTSRGPLEAIRVSKLGRAQLATSMKNTRVKTFLSDFSEEWSFLNGKIEHDSSDKIRMVMSLFTLSRSIYLEPQASLVSIQSPFGGALDELLEYIPGFWASLGFPREHLKGKKKKFYPKWKEFSFTSKKGPNGSAFQTLLWDLVSLNSRQIECIKSLGGFKLSKVIDMWLYFMKYTPYVFKSLITRRLAAISDKEGKTREIAIFDYWSQNALKGLHDYMFKLLRIIPQDCTFDQNKFLGLLDLQEKKEFNSIDLEKATDRFPIKLISALLKFNLGEKKIDEWEYLMVGEPFEIHCKDKTISVSYLSGNPMGALSSWSTFALCHHFIVYCACMRSGVRWQDLSYALLGDDIVINDNRTTEEYIKILSYIDVKYSVAKTHKSSTLYEFAKRYVYNGVEVSPFPVNAMITNSKNPRYLISDLLFVNEHGYNIPDITTFILKYLGRLGLSSKQRNRVKPSLMLARNFALLRWGLAPLRGLLEPIIKPNTQAGDVFKTFTDDEKDFIGFQALRVALQELLTSKELWVYCDDYPDDKNSISFGLSGLREMLSWYDLYLKYSDDTGTKVDLSSAIPLLSVTLSLQEDQRNRYKQIVRASQDPTKIDWAPLLDMMLVTSSDSTFSIQKKHISSEVSIRLKKGLEQYIQMINEYGLWNEFHGAKLDETEKFLFE